MANKKTTKNVFKEYKNEISLFALLIISYILLHKPFEQFFNKYIVDSFLKYIYANKWYNDLIFISYLLYISIKAYENWGKQYYLNRFYSVLFSTSLIYLINRFLNIWNFHSTMISDRLYYSDIILFTSLLAIILLVKTYYKNNFPKEQLSNNKNELGFVTDKPISEIEEDKLQYSNYANTIAYKILNTEIEKSFAIGINGKWGTGKTSFFNLIKKKIELNKEEIISIDFSPWNTENPRAIMTDFFETFEDRLNEYNSNISRKVSKYSEKLLSLNEIENVKPFYNFISSFISSNKTLSDLKCELEKNIEKINKKIIVYIDDLDRLDNIEIIEVLRLIRNTANFKNTFFIVAYDRNYVISALTNHNSYNKDGYLEKIFQLEINLPLFNSIELNKQLFENITSYFPEKKGVFQRILLNQEDTEFQEAIHENILSMRDVILISNSIAINYENLMGNVDFKDFLLLEILRIKFSNVYEILKNKNNQFIKENVNRKGNYNLSSSNDNGINLFYLLNNDLDLNIDITNVEKIKKMVNLLFGNRPNYLSLQNVSKYENYFSYRLSQKTLDENEFINYIESDINIIHKKITEWINKGYEFDLLKRFYAINKFNNFDEYKKNIRNILYLSEHKSLKSDKHIGFDLERLYILFCYNTIEFKKINLTLNDYKEFIVSLFNTKLIITEFKSNLLYNLISNNDIKRGAPNSLKFPLSEDELLKISEQYFIKYTLKNKKIEPSFITTLKCNSQKTKSYSDTNKYIYSQNFIASVINYFNTQKIDNLILIIIEKGINNSYSFNQEISDVFKGKRFLINYFEKREDINKSKYFIEFKNFYEKFNSEKINITIHFEFEIIPIL